jgi:hypothetical protein
MILELHERSAEGSVLGASRELGGPKRRETLSVSEGRRLSFPTISRILLNETNPSNLESQIMLA